MEEKPPAKVQHQKSYPVEFKLQVLDWYYSNGKNKLKTATHFNIHTKRIRDWELNEAFLRAHSDSPRRRFRMEKTAADTYGNIGKNLFQWYAEEKALGTEHSFGDLKSKAVQLATELNVQESFTVSDSWVRRWKKKYGVEDGRRRNTTVVETGVCEEGVVEVETGAGNCMDTGEHGDMITLPTILQVQGDAVDESIVYVSEPQPLAHTSEEVIDMVENPVTSDVQVHQHVHVSEGGSLDQAQIIAPISNAIPVTLQEPGDPQAQSITLGSTLLEHLLMSLNDTKKKLDQQEQLTRQALQRAEEAEKGVTDCKSRITVLELAVQQLRGNMAQTLPTDSMVTASLSLPLPLPLNMPAITVPIDSTTLPNTTTTTDSTN